MGEASRGEGQACGGTERRKKVYTTIPSSANNFPKELVPGDTTGMQKGVLRPKDIGL